LGLLYLRFFFGEVVMRYNEYSEVIAIYAMALANLEEQILACVSKQEATKLYQQLVKVDKEMRDLFLVPVYDQPDVPIVDDPVAMKLVSLLQRTLQLRKQLRASK